MSACTLDLKQSTIGSATSPSGVTSPDSGSPTTPAPTPVLDPISLAMSNLMPKSAKLSWQSLDAGVTTFHVAIQLGTTPPTDCESGSVQMVTGSSVDLSSLVPESTYSYRICAESAGVLSAGVTGQFTTLKLLTRAPRYPSFANWNDYINNDGPDIFNATGTTCTPGYNSNYSYQSCVHAGIIQEITLPMGVLCSDVVAYDFLDVFQWRCDSTSTPNKIFSTGIEMYRGLRHLVSATGFRNNYVIIEVNGVKTYMTDSEVWWSNTVENLPVSAPATVTSLTNGGEAAGKIFVVSTTREEGAYSFGENKLSLVVLDGVQLKLASGGASPQVSAAGRSYFWIEGDFNAQGNTSTVLSVNSAMMFRMTGLRLSNSSSLSMSANGAYFGMISDFHITNSGSVYLGAGGGMLFVNGRITNSISGFDNGELNTVSNVLLANNSADIIKYPSNSFLHNITMINNSFNISGYGIRLALGDVYNLFHNLNILNHGSRAIYQWRGGGNTYSQLLTAGSGTIDILTVDFSNKFTNNLIVDSGAACLITDDTAFDPGLINGTCENSGTSDALLTTTLDISKVIVGKIFTDDTSNTSDSLGSAPFLNLTDFFKFDNWFRSWGPEGSTFPNADNKGPCASGSCRIWDYRLKADTLNLAYNRTRSAGEANQPFVPGSTCPNAVNGNETTSHTLPSYSITKTFLTNAHEIIDDGLGDDDSLCESNEACIYNPNFGAYQGEGDYLAQGTCQFQDGTAITGVKMYAYPTNGVP